MQKLIIIGAGSYAVEVANIVAESGEFALASFIDTRLEPERERRLEGMVVRSLSAARILADDHLAVCALGTTHRADTIARAGRAGFTFATIRHPNALVPNSCTVGVGTIIGPGVIVGHGSHIAEHVILNRGCLVGHHTRIGRCTTVAPGANIAANVKIGRRAYIGMSAVVLDARRVGDRAVVGAGAVVTRDVPSRSVALGVPARVTEEDVDGL